MLLRVIFIVFFHFVWTTSALQCPDCQRALDFKTPGTINTTKLECKPVNALHGSCSQLLRIQYSKEVVSVMFEATPIELLESSNIAQMMVNTTMIWLDKIQFDRTIQIYCFHADACKEDTINSIYVQALSFYYSELWANLVTRLFDVTTDPADLVCADNDDKSVKCPYGFCKLISNDLTSFYRQCVLNGSTPNPYGVTLQSKTLTETEIESSVTYTCNKNMCNNLAMAKEIKKLLEVRKMLLYSATTTPPPTTTNVVTPKRSTGNIAKPLISIQCGMIFFMTLLFKH